MLSDNDGAFKCEISESVEKEVDDEDGATQQQELYKLLAVFQNNHVMYHVFLYMRTCVTSCFQNWLMAVAV